MNEKNIMQQVIDTALQDMRVELMDEFDRNFERKAFFSRAWQRRAGAYRSDKPLLIDTGRLRRSIKAAVQGNSLSFTSTEPYAAIHNEGGVITVTKRMKGYFWFKYRQAVGAFARKKDGSPAKNKHNLTLTTQAEFYRAMALMKEGKKIRIPSRRFIGNAPEVEQIIRESVLRALDEHLNSSKFELKIT